MRKQLFVLVSLFFAQGLILLGQNSNTTPTPDDMRRVGVYAWDGRPCGPTALIDSVQASKNLGSKNMVRIYAGPFWDYVCGTPDASPLDVKLRRGDYAWVLGAGFRTIWITAYPSADLDRYKTGGFRFLQLARYADRQDQLTAGETHGKNFASLMDQVHHLGAGARVEDWSGTREESRRAAYVAACSVPEGTRVIFSNWEAGNDVRDPSQWPVYISYLQARVNGANQGSVQAQTDGCKGQVVSVGEFIDPPSFPRAGMAQSDFLGVIAHLKGLGALSYSCWRTLDQDATTLQLSLEFGLRDIRDRSWQFGLPAELYLGEFGNPRTVHPDAAERMAIVITTALAHGVTGLVYWNLVDQVEFDTHGRFVGDLGLYDKQGQLTPFGSVFSDWNRQVSTIPVSRPVR